VAWCAAGCRRPCWLRGLSASLLPAAGGADQGADASLQPPPGPAPGAVRAGTYLVPARRPDCGGSPQRREAGFRAGSRPGPAAVEPASALLPRRPAGRVERWWGFRPGTPIRLPVAQSNRGVVVATGHYRNGSLLALSQAEADPPPVKPSESSQGWNQASQADAAFCRPPRRFVGQLPLRPLRCSARKAAQGSRPADSAGASLSRSSNRGRGSEISGFRASEALITLATAVHRQSRDRAGSASSGFGGAVSLQGPGDPHRLPRHIATTGTHW